MSLSVAELAMAIGKDENYVRQHIRRKNLMARKDGRRVSVEKTEAARWAKERGLPFRQATGLLQEPDDEVGTRAARMTVLAIRGTDGTSRNVFTLIRHQDHRSLGPWDKEVNPSWYSDTVPLENPGETKGLMLYRYDGKITECQKLVIRILQEGKLHIDGHEVQYALEHKPRRHWIYQDHTQTSGNSPSNPFTNRSAEITEYWCFDAAVQEQWKEAVHTVADVTEKMSNALHFPIHQRTDRAGNLMIAKVQDTVESEITARDGNRLVLSVASKDWTEPPQGAYSAAVWAHHCGDKVMQRSIDISQSETVLNLDSDVDLVGYEIYRNSNGECIERSEAYLIKEISIRTSVSGPRTELIIHSPRNGFVIKRQLNTESTGSVSRIMDEGSEGLDQGIRQRHREYMARESDQAARRNGKYRFRPEQVEEAVEHLAQLVRPKPGHEGPIYFVDPYFMAESEMEIRVLTALLSEATGQPLNILCGWPQSNLKLNYPKPLLAHATARNFVRPDERKRPAIHDRYLLTPTCETTISNSVSSWNEFGVTFQGSAFEVYRAETEELWSLHTGVNGNDKAGVLAREVNLW